MKIGWALRKCSSSHCPSFLRTCSLFSLGIILRSFDMRSIKRSKRDKIANSTRKSNFQVNKGILSKIRLAVCLFIWNFLFKHCNLVQKVWLRRASKKVASPPKLLTLLCLLVYLVSVKNINFKSSYNWFKIHIFRKLQPLTANYLAMFIVTSTTTYT